MIYRLETKALERGIWITRLVFVNSCDLRSSHVVPNRPPQKKDPRIVRGRFKFARYSLMCRVSFPKVAPAASWRGLSWHGRCLCSAFSCHLILRIIESLVYSRAQGFISDPMLTNSCVSFCLWGGQRLLIQSLSVPCTDVWQQRREDGGSDWLHREVLAPSPLLNPLMQG